MSLISMQVEELRNLADAMKYVKSNRLAKIMREAAETISELSEKVARFNMLNSLAYYFKGWIPMVDASPIKDGYYIICDEAGSVVTAQYKDGAWMTTGVTPYDVKAWTVLPEPMKVGEENC